MARGKKTKAPTKTAALKTTKAKAKAKATKPKPRARTGPPSSRIEAQAREEQAEAEALIDMLGCPTSTAETMVGVCDDQLELLYAQFSVVASAAVVWAERPEYAGLAAALEELATSMKQQTELLVQLGERFTVAADDESDHEDLPRDEVLLRIAPLAEMHEALED